MVENKITKTEYQQAIYAAQCDGCCDGSREDQDEAPCRYSEGEILHQQQCMELCRRVLLALDGAWMEVPDYVQTVIRLNEFCDETIAIKTDKSTIANRHGLPVDGGEHE